MAGDRDPPAQVKNYSVKFIFDDFLIAKPKTVAPPSPPTQLDSIQTAIATSDAAFFYGFTQPHNAGKSAFNGVIVKRSCRHRNHHHHRYHPTYIHLHLNCTLYSIRSTYYVVADPKQCQSFGIKLQLALNWMDG